MIDKSSRSTRIGQVFFGLFRRNSFRHRFTRCFLLWLAFSFIYYGVISGARRDFLLAFFDPDQWGWIVVLYLMPGLLFALLYASSEHILFGALGTKGKKIDADCRDSDTE